MKQFKLMSAAAVVAMFTACTQEELFNVDNNPQQMEMEEIIGAKLAGTDVSFNAAKDGEGATRMTITGNWEATDLIGLGWLVADGPYEVQSPEKMPTKSDLFANHMFSYDDATKRFVSKGNIYEGWYFAYYPWGYEKKTGVKFFEVNPAQTSKEIADRMSQGLYISNLQYISADSLSADNTMSKPFQMYGAVSYLQVRTTPDGEFKAGGVLADNAITSVTINADKEVFASHLRFKAKEIAPYNSEKTQEENLAGVMDFTNVLIPVDANNNATRQAVITTDVAQAGYKVSEEKTRLITIVTPVEADLDSTKISIEVAIDGGKFVIEYDKDAAEGSKAEKNNAAICALANAYKAGGKLTTTGNVQTLNVELYSDIFTTDFEHISNVDEWNKCVDLVDALGRSTEIFKIDSTIVFTDSIHMPKTCKLTVERATSDDDKRLVEVLALGNGEFNGWPKNLTSNVYLRILKDATLKNAHTVTNQKAIENYGTIEVPDGTKGAINTVGEGNTYTLTNFEGGVIKLGKYAKAQRVNNTQGRIEIKYGAYVGIRNAGEEGVIAFVVDQLAANNPNYIQNVITPASSGTLEGYACVNVLIFHKDNYELENGFDFTKAGSTTEEDPYTGSTTTDPEALKHLENVSLEITGQVVKSSNSVTVKNVKITGPNASLTGVKISGDLTVSEATVTTEAIVGKVVEANKSTINTGTIGGGITKATNASYINANTINGAIDEATNCVIVVDGNIVGNLNIMNSDVTAKTIEGNVVIKGSNNNIYGAKITGDVENKGTTTLEGVSIMSTLTNDGTITINGNDDIVIKKIVNNATLTANTTVNVEEIELKKGVAKTTVQEDPEKVIYFSKNYVQGGTTTGKILPSTIAVNGDTFEISDVDGLKAFAAMANNGNTFDGKTIKLTADIDLNNIAWTPIAVFKGTFDGNEKTISNLNVTAEKAAGFFANLYTGTIKNLTIDGANVKGSHHVGAIAGGSYGTIKYCTVKNAVISCVNPADGEDGDKAGAVIGYHAKDQAAQILNCTVLDSEVDAGRDAGQVVGAANAVNVVNCSAVNTTVSANGTANGENILNEVVGRKL